MKALTAIKLGGYGVSAFAGGGDVDSRFYLHYEVSPYPQYGST